MADDVIRTLLRARRQDGMGRVAGGMGAEATDRLANLDGMAQTIRAWSAHLIPGLLQTDTYAAGAIRTLTPSLSGEELRTRVKHRAVRQAEFLKRWGTRDTGAGPTTGTAWFVIGEAAILHPRLAAHGHAQQLRNLLEIPEQYPRIMVQMLREETPTPGDAGPFSLHQLAGGARVGHLESLVGGWYTTVPEDISRMYNAFSTMCQRALSPQDTREFIEEEITTCWAATSEHSSVSPHTRTRTTASM